MLRPRAIHRPSPHFTGAGGWIVSPRPVISVLALMRLFITLVTVALLDHKRRRLENAHHIREVRADAPAQRLPKSNASRRETLKRPSGLYFQSPIGLALRELG